MDIRTGFIGGTSECMFKRSRINRNAGLRVREHSLVENNITRDVYPIGGTVKTLIALMQRTIAKENTHLGTELKLVSIVLAKARPASTPENPKGGVVGLNMEQTEQRGVLVENWSGHTVDEVTCRKKSLIPKLKWKRGVRKQGKASLNQMSVIALGNTVLLRGMWT